MLHPHTSGAEGVAVGVLEDVAGTFEDRRRDDDVGVEVGQMRGEPVQFAWRGRGVGFECLGGWLGAGAVQHRDGVGVATVGDEAADELVGYLALSEVFDVHLRVASDRGWWGLDELTRAVVRELPGGLAALSGVRLECV
jgi:hypothetical protein